MLIRSSEVKTSGDGDYFGPTGQRGHSWTDSDCVACLYITWHGFLSHTLGNHDVHFCPVENNFKWKKVFQIQDKLTEWNSQMAMFWGDQLAVQFNNTKCVQLPLISWCKGVGDSSRVCLKVSWVSATISQCRRSQDCLKIHSEQKHKELDVTAHEYISRYVKLIPS